MDHLNTLVVRLSRDHIASVDGLYQYDYGQKLVLKGVSLPSAYEVHFSNTVTGESKTSIGDESGVSIPDEYLLDGQPVLFWVFLHDDLEDGETKYSGIINVTKRAKPTNEEPTPVQQDTITQTIAALNHGVGLAQDAATRAETAAALLENPGTETTTLEAGQDATVTYNDGTFSFGIPEGYSPTANVSKVGNTATITITDRSGTTTTQISDGAALIDDNAGEGDTNKSWSADKLTTELDLKAPKESPEFTGSISLGRKENTTIGVGSFAVGSVVEASGPQSHAEGGGTTASGPQSHAEGAGTTASHFQAHAEGAGTTASGYASHAEGASTQATNSNAHAEGASTTASGSNSHAEGLTTTASGSQSHTEGYLSAASAQNAHAEGYKTIANSANSHAEGSETQAINEHAHAEGNTTMASGTSSHAEGNLSVASMANAHAEGYHTSASGNNAHAEGDTTTASGQHSHAEGTNTQATANGAHAEGSGTKASGAYSHAEGSGYNTGVDYKYNTYNSSTNAIVSNTNNKVPGASGANSHTEGYRTFASGQSGHAEGYQTYAAENSSHAEGYQTYASNSSAHAEGNFTTASGRYSHAEGSYTLAGSTSAHAEGESTVAFHPGAHAEGQYTRALDDGSHAEGQSTKASNDGAHAEGGNTVASDQFSHAEGSNTTASGIAAHSEGYNTTASGTYSHAEGTGSRATGSNAHAEGSNTQATATNSHVEGSGAKATNQYAHAEGGGTTASGVGSHAEGGGSTASGANSHAEGSGTSANGAQSHAEGGGSVANGEESHAEGINTIASHRSQHVFGEYNVADTSTATSSNRGNYVEIVGNGANSNARSNVRVLDWNGNERLQGDLYVGCDSDSTGGTKVAKVTDIPDVSGKIDSSEKGVANGVATLDNSGKVPSAQLPSYVDDVIEVASYSALPETGESGKIYVTLDTNKAYRWSGSAYIEINPSQVVDVQVNGTTVVSSGIANVPVGGSSLGVFKTDSSYGIEANNEGRLNVSKASSPYIKAGTNQYKPITPVSQHESVFYGLAKVAGQDMASSSNAVGTYTDEAKTAIRSMIGAGTYSKPANGIPASDLANGVIPDISTKADKNNTVLTGSISLGRKANTTVGNNSYAVGNDVEASGAESHAEGYKTRALGQGSHAEGCYSEAFEYASHAEGYGTDAKGGYSHAEGCETEANGYYSHTEGYETYAYGDGSHAEGCYTDAEGDYSHAEGLQTYAHGNYSHSQGHETVANGASSTAFGKYNVEDTSLNLSDIEEWAANTAYVVGDVRKRTVTNDNVTTVTKIICKKANSDATFNSSKWYQFENEYKYIEIAGNGLDHTHRSNARTLDWNGNEYLAGNIYVGCNSDSTGGTRLPHDVQVNGTSVVSNGVANIPVGQNSLGVVTQAGMGVTVNASGHLALVSATDAQIKSGSNSYIYQALVPARQHQSVFYGLAKAAGDSTQASSSNAVGTYTDDAKSAIRSMIGAENGADLIKVQDTQPTDPATMIWLPETAPSSVQVPTYSEFQALETTVGGKVGDVQVNGTSIVQDGVANIPYAGYTTPGVVRVQSTGNLPGLYGLTMGTGNDAGELMIVPASETHIKQGITTHKPITPAKQHRAVFYGLATAAGDTTQKNSDNAVGTYTADAKSAIQSMLGVPGDVQVNGTSIVSNGVANIPIMTAVAGGYGVARADTGFGTGMASNGAIALVAATDQNIKAGTDAYRPIVSKTQHTSIFYGLSKLAGVDLASQTVTVGTYPETSKTAIRNMLGVETGTTLVETVSGTTPSITAAPNVRYNCGEVSTIDITPPSSGTCDIFFTSGSTAAILTVPNTVKFPAWFDATALDTNTIYEIMITDATYGSVMTWAS